MQSYLYTLRTEVGQGKSEAVISKLLDLASKGQSAYINEIILLESRLNELRAKERQGLLSDSETYEKRQVNASLLKLIDEMEGDPEIRKYLGHRFQTVFSSAKEKYNTGDFEAALPLFLEADNLQAEPEVSLLIQACRKALGMPEGTSERQPTTATPSQPEKQEKAKVPAPTLYYIGGGILLLFLLALLIPDVRKGLFGPPAPTLMPDLAVTAFQFHPNPPVQGEPVEVQFRVENQGQAGTPVTEVHWWAESGAATPACEKTVKALAPGEKVDLTCTYAGYAQASEELVSKVVVDPNRQLTEASTANNTWSEKIRIAKATQPAGPVPAAEPAKKADLIITGFDLSPYPPTQGEPVTVSITVKNQGNQNAGPCQLQWWAGVNFPGPAYSETLSGLLAGQSRTFQYTYAGYPSWYGNLTTRAVVDGASQVEEENENNNTRERTISVKKSESPPAPVTSQGVDLVAAGMQMNPSPPVQRQPVTVQIAVENQGTVASGSFRVEWWAGENFPNPAHTETIPRLEAGRRKVLTFQYEGYTSWYGSLTTKMVVDPDNRVSETNTQNNVRKQQISVRKPQ